MKDNLLRVSLTISPQTPYHNYRYTTITGTHTLRKGQNEQKPNLSFARRNRSRPTGHQVEERSGYNHLKHTYKTKPWPISIDADSYRDYHAWL